MAPGKVWMFTPSTPARAMAKVASSAHQADAKVSLTPRLPLHATEVNSSTGTARWWACAVLAKPITLSASPSEEAGASRFGIVGYWGELLAVEQRSSGER